MAVLGLLAASPAQAAGPETSCAEAGAAAEQAWGLPSGLLNAIGLVESGRPGVAGGTVAWPWTINAAGQGYHFSNKAEAVSVVAMFRERGVRSIDVGCFQINLVHHPLAFATLEHGFDPLTNADYAARFLTDLRDRTGSWEAAVAAYHSATPGRGDAYRARVFAAWTGGPRAGVVETAALPPAITGGMPVVSDGLPRVIFGPAPVARPAAGHGAVVWTIANQAMGMKVWNAGPRAASPIRGPG
jgi:hypothetical protein